MRLTTSEVQGHDVDEPEAFEEARRRSLGEAPRPLASLIAGPAAPVPAHPREALGPLVRR